MKMTETKTFKRYLLSTFVLAWLLQIGAGIFYQNGRHLFFTILLLLAMYCPFLGVLAAKVPLKEIGWRLPLRNKKWLFFLTAWFLPVLLAALGAILYFAVKPQAFDATAPYITSQFSREQLTALEAGGLTPFILAFLTSLSAALFAPFVNMLLALGEEVGWRGFMHGYLKEKFGLKKGVIYSGLIWGIWHWPIMFFGYEYGTDYWGYPVVGCLLFLVFTTAFAVLLDWIFAKTGSIWAPSLMHGSVNAAVFGLYFLKPAFMNDLLFGPLPIGLLGGIPLLTYSIWVYLKYYYKKS
ncbi:hypothetical protein A0O21_09430 [Streptococcus pantholopis]|uniref:CAAX prenyl protease 2/Lysostaphin resistance protein A-like domain-containing protein n=2 Tax=Streptococcus pantholopis TaxID=1811193 RepID=A0A172Q9S6_9STRE|nr:hypothetical protein A0O21_09430 [Streptococcus pantholopis]